MLMIVFAPAAAAAAAGPRVRAWNGLGVGLWEFGGRERFAISSAPCRHGRYVTRLQWSVVTHCACSQTLRHPVSLINLADQLCWPRTRASSSCVRSRPRDKDHRDTWLIIRNISRKPFWSVITWSWLYAYAESRRTISVLTKTTILKYDRSMKTPENPHPRSHRPFWQHFWPENLN